MVSASSPFPRYRFGRAPPVLVQFSAIAIWPIGAHITNFPLPRRFGTPCSSDDGSIQCLAQACADSFFGALVLLNPYTSSASRRSHHRTPTLMNRSTTSLQLLAWSRRYGRCTPPLSAQLATSRLAISFTSSPSLIFIDLDVLRLSSSLYR